MPSPRRMSSARSGAITLYTVDLARRDYDAFYRGFANGTLWPTLHYQVGHAHFDWAEFAGYRRVNALFAQALARLVRPDDLIWAHDYHLLCLAEALREAGLRNRMGLFLHTPFPAPAVFMTNPAHAELIRAMCRFDLLGFQTEDDRSAFADYVVRRPAAARWMRGAGAFGRTVKTGVYPIGVHVDEVRARGGGAGPPALCVAAARQPARAAADPQRRSAGLLQGPAAALHRVRAVPGALSASTTARWCSCRSRRRRAAISRPIARSAANWKPRPAGSTAASPRWTGCRCAT